MMEKKAESIRKELEKLNARLARQQAKLSKKSAAAEKVGATCTREEWYAGMREAYTAEQKNAWFELDCAFDDVAETERQIANAETRLAKVTCKVEAQQEANANEAAEIERVNKIETRFLTFEQMVANRTRAKEEYEEWLSEFKAECMKDGIKIEEATANYFSGWTKGGKRFRMEGNNGWTERSFHCYTLRIAGETIFTSGEFLTGYRYLKNH